MPLTRSTSDATRVTSSLIPQKRKPATAPSTDSDAEGQATDADPEALTAADNTDGDTWSDVDQDDASLPSMNELIDQVILLDNKRQSPWTERGAPDKPLHWANQYIPTQQWEAAS